MAEVVKYSTSQHVISILFLFMYMENKVDYSYEKIETCKHDFEMREFNKFFIESHKKVITEKR